MDALLFMKGNSERIPNKNIKDFNGKPLFFYIINTLLEVEKINNIYIDTDSYRIFSLINEYFYNKRIKLMERPEYLKGELVTANDLISGMLNRVDGEEYIQVHTTTPLLTSGTINKAIIIYHANKPSFDSLFGVTRHQGCFYNFSREPINHSPDQIERTQDLPPVYEDNSTMYIFDRKCFELWGRIGLNPYMFEVGKLEGIDIDEPEDWVIAESINERRVSLTKV